MIRKNCRRISDTRRMYRLPQHNQSEKKKSRILLSFRNVWSWAGFWKGTQRRQGKETLSAENRPEGGIAERPLNQCCAEPGRSENDQIQTRAVAGRSILHRAKTLQESLAGTQCMNRWDEGSWDMIPIDTEGSPS